MRLRNELDDFISNKAPSATARGLSPRRMLNNLNQQSKPVPNKNVSPNRINHTRKPMISPVKQQRTQAQNAPVMGQMVNRGAAPRAMLGGQSQGEVEYFCANESHRSKKAEYVIPLQDEDMYYCGVCATQAASQGFTVTRLTSKINPQLPPAGPQKQLPHYPHMQRNPRAKQLTQIMQDILSLQSQFNSSQPKHVKEHYQQQQTLLNQFYDQIVSSVERMREEHLGDLKKEEQSSRQHCEMHYENLKMHMEDLNDAWVDIEEHFEMVAEEMGEAEYQSGAKQYRKNIEVFRVKLEEYADFMENFTAYQSSELTQKVALIEERLGSLWQGDQPHQVNLMPLQPSRTNANSARSAGNVKNMHQKLPHTAIDRNCEGQAAFRNIFPDDDQGELPNPAPSPQFKNI